MNKKQFKEFEFIPYNLLPEYGTLYTKSNMVLFIFRFYDFDLHRELDQSLLGRYPSGRTISPMFISSQVFIIYLYFLICELLPETILNDGQSIIELSGHVKNEDGSIKDFTILYKTKFKEKYENMELTATKDWTNLVCNLNVESGAEIRPDRIVIKFLLNKPHNELTNELNFVFEKIKLLKKYINYLEKTVLFDLLYSPKHDPHFSFTEFQDKIISIIQLKK